jgi:flagellar protein FlbD
MIEMTRLNGHLVVVNAELIETVESTPDTVVALTSGKKLVVLESPGEVVERVVQYRQRVGLSNRLTAIGDELPAAQRVGLHED